MIYDTVNLGQLSLCENAQEFHIVFYPIAIAVLTAKLTALDIDIGSVYRLDISTNLCHPNGDGFLHMGKLCRGPVKVVIEPLVANFEGVNINVSIFAGQDIADKTFDYSLSCWINGARVLIKVAPGRNGNYRADVVCICIGKKF